MNLTITPLGVLALRVWLEGEGKGNQVETYEEVAEHHKLDPSTAKRFICYMRLRGWASEETTQCHVGYAGEWAERFKAGIEVEASDHQGRAVLIQMARQAVKDSLRGMNE